MTPQTLEIKMENFIYICYCYKEHSLEATAQTMSPREPLPILCFGPGVASLLTLLFKFLLKN